MALDLLGFVLATALITVLYAAAIGRRFRLGPALPGIAVSASGFVIVVVGTRIYLAVAGDMRAIYGTLGGIVLAMLATWFVVYVILLGAAVGRQWTDSLDGTGAMPQQQ